MPSVQNAVQNAELHFYFFSPARSARSSLRSFVPAKVTAPALRFIGVALALLPSAAMRLRGAMGSFEYNFRDFEFRYCAFKLSFEILDWGHPLDFSGQRLGPQRKPAERSKPCNGLPWPAGWLAGWLPWLAGWLAVWLVCSPALC
jgi:hypothetical protein